MFHRAEPEDRIHIWALVAVIQPVAEERLYVTHLHQIMLEENPARLYCRASSIIQNHGRNRSSIAIPDLRFPTLGLLYDYASQEIILFSGETYLGADGETWAWDGSDWAQKFPRSSPLNRYGGSMVYDAACQELLLFGGYSGAANKYINDTWLWSGENWKEAVPAHSPVARAYPAMAYDARHSIVLLFGGQYWPTNYQDTWTWNCNGIGGG
jgi:hypothetical protein